MTANSFCRGVCGVMLFVLLGAVEIRSAVLRSSSGEMVRLGLSHAEFFQDVVDFAGTYNSTPAAQRAAEAKRLLEVIEEFRVQIWDVADSERPRAELIEIRTALQAKKLDDHFVKDPETLVFPFEFTYSNWLEEQRTTQPGFYMFGFEVARVLYYCNPAAHNQKSIRKGDRNLALRDEVTRLLRSAALVEIVVESVQQSLHILEKLNDKYSEKADISEADFQAIRSAVTAIRGAYTTGTRPK